MTKVLDLVEFSTIRSQIGLSPAEVSDATLQAIGMDDELELFLLNILPEWKSLVDDQWTTTDIPAESVAKAQLIFRQLVKFQCAAILARQIEMLGLRLLTDGNNRGERFHGAPDDMYGKMKGKVQELLDQLLDVLDLTALTTDFFNPFGLSRPTYDPVTGTGRTPRSLT